MAHSKEEALTATPNEHGEDTTAGQPINTDENKSEELETTNTGQDLELGNQATNEKDLVDWEGPDDPENPMNWSQSKKRIHVTMISALSLLVNLGTTIFAPGAPLLIAEFGVTDSMIAALTVSLYLLGFGLGPFVMSPLSEYYGRLPIYHVSNLSFFGFTLGCAFSPNVSVFLAMRFFAGFGGSTPLTLGGGSIADIIPQEKRGTAMAVFFIGPLLGPVFGPIAGGFIAQDIGWRWTFWILAIASGVATILGFIVLRETYGDVILRHKASKLRKTTGNIQLKAKHEANLSPRKVFFNSVVRPMKLLFLSPIVLLLSLFTALLTGLIFLLFTTFPTVFEQQYGFSTGTSGLAYLGLGLGLGVGTFILGKMSDKILKRLSKDGPMKPEYRLPLMVMFTPIIPAGFFWYGWSAYYQTHWIVPILGSFIIGLGMMFGIMPAQSYLVDAYGKYAASALAAITAIRSLGACFFPLAGPPLYANLGLGWGNTLLGFLALGMACIPLFFYKFGERIRTRWEIQL